MKKILVTLMLVLIVALNGFAFAAPAEDDTAGKVNLNKATAAELAKIPGLTEPLANKILELRKVNGEFVDMSELLQVPGIDSKLLRQIEKNLFIEKASDCNC